MKIRYDLAAALIIILLVILVVSISGCTNHTQSTVNNTKTFSEEGLNFSYPESWTLNQTQFPQNVSNYNLKELGTLSAPQGFNVFIEKSASPSSSSDYIQKFKDLSAMGINNINTTINSENSTQINGLNAYEIVMTVNDPQYDMPQKVLCVVVEKDQNVYMIQFITENGSFDEYLPIFNNLTSTIKLA